MVLVSGILKACWMLSHGAGLGGARWPPGCSHISSCSEMKPGEEKYTCREEEHLEGRGGGLKILPGKHCISHVVSAKTLLGVRTPGWEPGGGWQ